MMTSHRTCGLFLAIVASACTPKADLSDAGGSNDALARASLEILSLSPPAGGAVDASTVVEAELEYAVPDVEAYPGPYSVDVMFRTERGVSIRPATPAERAANGPIVVELLEPRGRARLRYPLSAVLGQPELAVPLTLEFVLEDRSGRQADESTERLTSAIVPIAEATAQFSIQRREPGN